MPPLPRMHRRWAHPYARKMIGAVTATDFPMSLHICGDSTLILPEMLATGAPILELDYRIEMAHSGNNKAPNWQLAQVACTISRK